MVGQLDSLLSLQTKTAQIGAYIVREISQTNTQIVEMSQQLDDLGSHIIGPLASVESAVRVETEIQRKHYEGVEQEHVLKSSLQYEVVSGFDGEIHGTAFSCVRGGILRHTHDIKRRATSLAEITLRF